MGECVAYVTDDELKDQVAAVLAKAGRVDLVGSYDTLISTGNLAAYRIICDTLLTRGFTQAQIDAWDSRVIFNRMLGIYWTLISGPGLLDAKDILEPYNWEERLKTVQVSASGIVTTPAGAADVEGGDLDTTDDIFVLEEGTGEVTIW